MHILVNATEADGCCVLTVINSEIVQDKRRKFIWEEMSFLERWWRDASEVEKKDFKHLVKTGQLEIVGGGWVMNDEVVHYDVTCFRLNA